MLRLRSFGVEVRMVPKPKFNRSGDQSCMRMTKGQDRCENEWKFFLTLIKCMCIRSTEG